jgi:hypothetical protein
MDEHGPFLDDLPIETGDVRYHIIGYMYRHNIYIYHRCFHRKHLMAMNIPLIMNNYPGYYEFILRYFHMAIENGQFTSLMFYSRHPNHPKPHEMIVPSNGRLFWIQITVNVRKAMS